MNILIDIGHPAHIHNYRNLATELEKKGHKIVWSTKDIPVAKQLLDFYGFKYYLLPQKADSLINKVRKQLYYNFKLLRICKKEKIQIALGTSVTISHISAITKINSIVFDDDDDDVQPFITKYVNPYASSLLSPEALRGKRKRKDTIYYPGYHELAYLHPKRFSPDPSVLKDAGLEQGASFFLLRFNVFKAHHDVGVKGLSLAQKLKLIAILKPYGKVFITTEREIEPELKEYQLKIKPEKIHSLLSYSRIFISDSQTMTSEAAMLGIPSLRCNSFVGRISYLEEEEQKFKLTFGFLPENFDQMQTKLVELLTTPNLNNIWQIRRKKMLSEKIDVTAFWVWYIENYIKKKELTIDNESFWNKFK